MSRLVLNILFSFFLLLQTSALAEEEAPRTEIPVEEQEIQENNASEETEVRPDAGREERGDEGSKEALSEAQKEALAAEEAELREAGIYDEGSIEE
mgnify:CR=1 FL=1